MPKRSATAFGRRAGIFCIVILTLMLFDEERNTAASGSSWNPVKENVVRWAWRDAAVLGKWTESPGWLLPAFAFAADNEMRQERIVPIGLIGACGSVPGIDRGASIDR